jgi:hypothetical protein
MAVITVSSNTNLDELTYTTADDIVVSNNARLTIRKSNAVTFGTLTCSDGEVLISTQVTGADSTISHLRTNNTTINAAGRLVVRGDWVQLGVGDGEDNQTFTNPFAYPIPYLQVETGNGTDVWVDCYNLGTSTSTIHPGKYSAARQFKEATGTITFGSVAGGMHIPAVGARIRYPSILAVRTDNNINAWTINNGAYVDIDKFAVSSHNPNSYQANITIENCSHAHIKNFAVAVGNFYFNYNSDPYIDGAMQAFPRTSGTCRFWQNAPATLNRLTLCTHSSQPSFIGTTNATISNSYIGITNPLIASYVPDFSSTSNIIFNNVLFIRSVNLKDCYNLTFNDCEYMYLPTGATDTTTVNAFYVEKGSDITFNRLTIDYSPPRNSVIYLRSGGDNVQIYDSTLNLDLNTQQVFYFYQGGQLIGKNLTINGPLFRMADYSLSYSTKFHLKDVRIPEATTITTTPSGGDIDLKAIATGTLVAPTVFVVDVDAITAATNAGRTAGELAFFMCPPAVYDYHERVSGACRYNYAGGYIFRNSGDEAIFTPINKIYGITGFTGHTTTEETDVTHYYSLSTDRSSWGTWKALTTANLETESFTSSDGFYIRFRTLVSADLASDFVFTGYRIQTTIDPDYNHPELGVPITLENIVPGSNYYIYKISDNSVVASGIAYSDTVVTDGAIAGQVGIRVRKAGYVPFETGGNITASGLSTWISQVEDNIYEGA